MLHVHIGRGHGLKITNTSISSMLCKSLDICTMCSLTYMRFLAIKIVMSLLEKGKKRDNSCRAAVCRNYHP